MKYVLNGIGKHLIGIKSKELVKFAWAALPTLLLMYLAIKYGMDDQVLMYFFMAIIYVLFWIYIPINFSINIKKVILKIEFLENQIKIETKKGVFYLKKIQVNKAIGRFTGFGKGHTNGYIIKDNNDKNEYWLIETFFNEMEDIEIELKKYM